MNIKVDNHDLLYDIVYIVNEFICKQHTGNFINLH